MNFVIEMIHKYNNNIHQLYIELVFENIKPNRTDMIIFEGVVVVSEVVVCDDV